MTRAAAMPVLLIVLAAGCGGGTKSHFQRANGWQLLSGHDELAAADVPFVAADPRSMDDPPSHTVGSLPRNGIVIWLLVGRRRPAYDAKFPAVPMRVGKALVTNPPEGFFCPPAAQSDCFSAGGAIRRLQVRASGWDIGLTIFFGTDHPPAAQVRAADAELARLSL